MPFISVVVFFVILGVGFYLAKRSADRFEGRKRALGEWDENGPKHPSEQAERYKVRYMLSGGGLFSNLSRPEPRADDSTESGSESAGNK